jgi:predicted ATP-dependent serine protease
MRRCPDCLATAGLFHPSEILLPSKQELLRKLDLVDSADVAAIVQAVSRGLTPRSLAVSDLVERDSRRWLQTGDAAIDMLLGGGVRRGTITEIAGER